MNSRRTRTKRIFIGSFSLVFSTGLTLAVGLIIAGMLARYFTSEEFGLWSILISLNGILLSGFDFGFGNALRNRMAQLYAGREDEKNKIYFFSVFCWFSFSAIALSLIFCSVKPLIPWTLLFKSSDVLLVRTGSCLMTLGGSILAFNIAFNVYTAGFFSHQESHWNALLNGISKLILLLLTVLFVLTLQSFFTINLLTFLITLLSSMTGFIVFLAVRKWGFAVIPIREIVVRVKELWLKSAQFACLQVFSTVLLMADLFVVSKILGLEIVGEYFLVKRLYLVLASFHFAILVPVWSAYTESIESRDVHWAKKTFRKAAVYTVVVFILGVTAMYFGGNYIIYWWTGKEITNMSLFFWLGMWGFMYGWSNCFSVFLNATGYLKYQVILGGFAATAFVPLSLLWGGSHGVVGVCMALVAVSLPFAIFAPIESICILNRLHRARGGMVLWGHHE
jgi:O-antigen/teichoic acid export membrane protein